MSEEKAIQMLENFPSEGKLIIVRRIYECENELEYCFEAYYEGETPDDSCYWNVAKDLSGCGPVLE